MENERIHMDHRNYPGYKLFGAGGLFVTIGAIMILSMQFETLPIPIEVQIMPLTSVIAFVVLPFVLRDIEQSPLLLAVTLFTIFVSLHSVVFLVIDLFRGEPPIRMFSWFRQFSALILGVSIYLVFRKTLQHLEKEKIARYVILGAIPPAVLSVMNVLWGALGQQWAGDIVLAVRTFTAPTGHTSPFRASGFALEPSHFATILVILVLPFVFILFSEARYRKLRYTILILLLLSFAWTFSLMGFLVLAFTIFVGLLLGPNKRFLLTLLLFLAVLLVGSYVFFPNNQIVRNINALIVGVGTISFDDRFYGTFGPFLSTFSSFTMIGYGLGGTVSHFDKIIPDHLQSAIAAVKWEDLPNLATLVGRLMAETGAFGLFFFMLMVGVGFWQLQMLLAQSEKKADIVYLQSVRLGLLGTLFSLTFAFGSFHLPFLWFWLAFIDSRYLHSMETRSTNV